MMTDREEYAKRLYDQAIADPDTNATNWDEIESNIRRQAKRLYLDPEGIVEIVKEQHRPVSTDDFKRATVVDGGL